MLCFAPAAFAAYIVSMLVALAPSTQKPGPLDPTLLNIATVIVWAAAIFAVAVVEAAFISGLGSTPGKWIFGVRVRGAERGKLPFQTSLKRALIVYTLGMGLCIPIVAPASWAVFAWRLRTTGSTPWDNVAGSVVAHEDWKRPRALVCWMVGLIAVTVHAVLVTVVFYG